MELNHPFFIYPREPLSHYNNYELYRNELLRLNEFIKNFNYQLENSELEESEVLLSIILGSTMEDAILKSFTPESNIFQSSQLFPSYIKNFIEKDLKKKNKLVQIIIISPDNFFANIDYSPVFTNFIEIEFNKISLYEFIGSTLNTKIKINIFNCPFPSLESRNNLIEKYNKIFIDFIKNPEYKLKTFSQTSQDKIFIDEFYKNLETVLKKNDYKKNDLSIIINSWVSFKNLDGVSENYSMFYKLLEISNIYNIIATEWDFVDELFSCKIVSNFHIGNKFFKNRLLFYVLAEFENIILDKDIQEINYNYIKSTTNTLFKIDFCSEYLLDNFDL
jgi:hypothetical protein